MDKKIVVEDEETRKRVASIAAQILRHPDTPRGVRKIAAGILSSYRKKKPGQKKRTKEKNGPSIKKSPKS